MNPQAIIDGLVSGSTIGLGAIGLTLTYSILRFANFTHGDFLAWGAYLTLTVAGVLGGLAAGLGAPVYPFSFGWGLPLAILGGVVLTVALALGLDRILFGRLRARGADTIIIVMASFGASMALRSLLEFIFTAKPAYFTKALQIAKPLGLGMRATPDQLLVIGLTLVLVLALHLVVTHSATGRAMRAVSENPGLAGVYGIDVGKVVRVTWIIGAGMACIAGVMAGLLVQIRPYMGFDLLLPLFAAAILGGIGSIPGAMLGGLIIGLVEAFAVQIVGAEWRAAISFVILVLVLMLRPQGIFGQRGA
ncbi:MAG: branched-chain amino acid ABC transporter permease [Hoeflea sp.]|uniref:branched-chain amino acid ABC transporter permease n=1 Tax=Hoeflea sp. TaxID=1940281 RepID=UPI002730B95C|nr:branched-chain amino acid ABC transporter permease [Hoeflea sp.]MDP2118657.1 branched-chain amino acid ABC transporter permease [Hoeflea sp.]MDP3527538.1 branched-chain amino acid ABC transporter permease [Hoeflea sp.]